MERLGEHEGFLQVGGLIAWNHGQDKRSLKKFEKGEEVDFPDEKINAYVMVLGVTLLEIHDRARPFVAEESARDDDPATTSLDEIEPEETDRDTENDEEAEEDTG